MRDIRELTLLVIGIEIICFWPFSLLHAESESCRVEISVNEAATGQPVPCRIHLKNEAGKAVLPDGLPHWRDHFVCPGKVQLNLTAGSYSYEVERGPEYVKVVGSFLVSAATNTNVVIELKRFVDLAAEGWWPGDLHVHRPAKDIELLMQAEDLHVAPVTTWWNNKNQWATQPIPPKLLVKFDGNRFYHVMAGEDESEGSAHRPCVWLWHS